MSRMALIFMRPPSAYFGERLLSGEALALGLARDRGSPNLAFVSR